MKIQTTKAQQVVAPNRSLPSSQNPTSSVRESDHYNVRQENVKLRTAARIGGVIAATVGLLLAWLFVSGGLRGGTIEWRVVEKTHRDGLNHILSREVGSDTGSLSSYYTDSFYRRAMPEDTIKTTSWGVTILSRGGETLWIGVSKGTKLNAVLLLFCSAPLLLARDWRSSKVQVYCHACALIISAGVCAYVLWSVLSLTIYYA